MNDLKQLKEWVEKYYVRGEKDAHYEHLVVNHHTIRGQYYTFCFAETQEDFTEGDYGIVHYTTLPTGRKKDTPVINYVVQKFVSCVQVKNTEMFCRISKSYQELRSFKGAAAIACPASAFAAVNPQQDDANSWRYENGQLAARQQDASGADAIPAGAGLGAIARLSSENIGLLSGPAWSLTFDGFTDGNGGVVDGVIARGVDVSEWNQDIDWEAVRDDGIKYAIIRVGYGSDYSSQDDKWWERNVSECERLGIPFGVYLYSYAQDAEMAQSEAEHVLRLIDGHDLTYPVYFDMEDASQLRATGYDPDALAEIACTFCDAIEDAGYDVGIYANKYWFDHYLIDECFDAWPRWVAQYNTVCDYDGDYSMWQYSSGGRVAGIDHPTDDFGAQIRARSVRRQARGSSPMTWTGRIGM